MTLYESSSASAMLDLIWRKAPLFMKAGGGALSISYARKTQKPRRKIVPKTIGGIDSGSPYSKAPAR